METVYWTAWIWELFFKEGLRIIQNKLELVFSNCMIIHCKRTGNCSKTSPWMLLSTLLQINCATTAYLHRNHSIGINFSALEPEIVSILECVAEKIEGGRSHGGILILKTIVKGPYDRSEASLKISDRLNESSGHQLDFGECGGEVYSPHICG